MRHHDQPAARHKKDPTRHAARKAKIHRVPHEAPHGVDHEADKGETLAEQMGALVPRLPHEIDESAHSQSSPPRKVIEQAFDDVESGLVDAGPQPVMDDLYRREFKGERDQGAADPATEAPRPRRLRKRRP